MGITSTAPQRLTLASGDDSTKKHNSWRILSADHLDWSGHPGLSPDHIGCPSGAGQFLSSRHLKYQLACCSAEQRRHQRRRTPRLPERANGMGPGPIELTGSDGNGVDVSLRPSPQGTVLWDSRRVRDHSRRAIDLDNERSPVAPTRTELLRGHRDQSGTQSDCVDHRFTGSR